MVRLLETILRNRKILLIGKVTPISTELDMTPVQA
jgi:hypothetical protein